MSSSQSDSDANQPEAQAADQGQDSADASKVTAPAHMRPKQRRYRDMTMSLAVLLVPLALVFMGWSWIAQDRTVSVVDPSGTYASANSADLDLRVPDLHEDWKPISQAFDTEAGPEEDITIARVGWHSPDGEGFQLVHTSSTLDEYVLIEFPDGATLDDQVTVGGIDWDLYTGSDSVVLWLAEIDGVTTGLLAQAGGTEEMTELAQGVIDGDDVETWTQDQFDDFEE